MNAGRDRHSVISLTLPIFCQICLGKVKQPVLCPNDHVFCSACMDVWLQRNKQCPSCRTPVDPVNPIRQIKGSLIEMEDKKDIMSSPSLRKARFDLLYQDFENELTRLNAETTILKRENAALKDQSKNAKIFGSINEKTKFIQQGTQDSSGLNALTGKLQDAQKLYEHLKQDMSKLREENKRLEDENVDLNRENEKLRMEIANRSPHRYGRYTVATLEVKIQNYEKEIRQLNKALERSDRYVADLENRLKGLKDTSKESAGAVHDVRRLFNEPHNASSSDNPAKRQLFGSYIDDLRNLSASSKMDPKTVEISFRTQKNGGDTNSVHDDNIGSISSLAFNATKEKSPKKVHFSLPKNSNESCSFDLDKPSPFDPSKSMKTGRTSPSEFASRHYDSTGYDSRRSGVSQFSLDEKTDTQSDLKEQKSILRNPTLNERYSDKNEPPSSSRRKQQNDTNDLDDTQTIRSELDDLNISLTPELSDCMKLLNRAEKKRHVYEEEKGVWNSDSTRVEQNPFSSSVPTQSYRSNSDVSLSSWKHEHHDWHSSNSFKQGNSSKQGQVPSSGNTQNIPSSLLETKPYKSKSVLPSFYQLPSSTGIPKFKANGNVQDIDYKLLSLGISVDKKKPLDTSHKVNTSARSGFAFSHERGTVPDNVSHSSFPATTVLSGQDAISPVNFPSFSQVHRRSSLDGAKTIESQKGLYFQHKQALSRKYSSLTNIPTANSDSAPSTYSNTLDNHFDKLKQIFAASASMKSTPQSSEHGISCNSNFSLYLTGGATASASSTATVALSTRPLAYTASRPSLPRYVMSSAANTSASSSSQGTYPSPSLDNLGSINGEGERGQRGNFSFVSNASNDISSRGSDSFLPEPKKRLFESGDDLDLTLSPIKSTRVK